MWSLLMSASALGCEPLTSFRILPEPTLRWCLETPDQALGDLPGADVHRIVAQAMDDWAVTGLPAVEGPCGEALVVVDRRALDLGVAAQVEATDPGLRFDAGSCGFQMGGARLWLNTRMTYVDGAEGCGGYGEVDLRATLDHHIGHAVGLRHQCDPPRPNGGPPPPCCDAPDSVMAQQDACELRTPGPSDVQWVDQLYHQHETCPWNEPWAPDPLETSHPVEPPSGCGGGRALLVLPLASLRARRRSPHGTPNRPRAHSWIRATVSGVGASDSTTTAPSVPANRE